MENSISETLLKRFTLLKNLEYFIEESVYYRSHFDEISTATKTVLLSRGAESGKIQVS